MDNKHALEIIERYISFLVLEKNLSLHQVYLFGSYAKNKQTDDSDIDVAIVFQQLENRLEMQQNLMKWRRKFDLALEPHPFDKKDFNKNNPFAFEIISTGLNLSIDKFSGFIS